MPNSIKYSTGTETKALRSGNFYIAVGDDAKAPTSTNGFWTGYDAPEGGWVVYLNKESNGPSIYVCNSDSDVIGLINRVYSQSFTTIEQCLEYSVQQVDILIMNNQYPTVTTDGLVLNLDARFVSSYPRTGNTWYNNSISSSNASLINEPTFNSNNWINFDGSNDYCDFTADNLTTTASVTMLCKIGSGYSNKMFMGWLFYDVYCASGTIGYNTGNGDVYGISQATVTSLNIIDRWAHYIFEFRSDVAYTNNKIYINGNNQNLSQQLSSESSGSRNFNSGNGRIALWRGGTTSYHMPMDCVKFEVYNRSLSQSEVLQNFYQGNIVTQNISALYTASNLVSFDSGTSSVYYMTGTSTNLNGVLQNGVTFSPNYGGFWSFDGSNDRILLNGATTNAWQLNSNLNWTVSAWIRTSTTVGNSLGQGPVFSNSSGVTVYSVMCVNNGRATYWHYNNTWLRKSGSIKINDGNWYQITWVNRSNGTMDIYVNEQLDANNVSSTLSSTNHLDIIGGSWAGAFSGDIASLQINNGVAFTREQVIQNYRAMVNKFRKTSTLVTNGLVLHLDALNTDSYSGSGNTWFDLSGNGNHATKNGQTGNPTWDSTNGWFFSASVLGVNGGFTISNSSSIQNLTTITVFLVIAMQTKTLVSGDTDWKAIYSKHGADQRIAISINQTPNSTLRYLHIEAPSATNSPANTFTNDDYTGTKFNIIAARINGSGTTGWLNGNIISTSVITTTGNTSTLYLGLDIDNEMFRGYMKSVLTYNRDLSNREMSEVFTYLNRIYSVY